MLHLFRMLQEILHNTIKHAGAKQFSSDAWTEGPELFVETRDDGRGFDLGAAQEKGGLGLQNILVRARMIGARMDDISSSFLNIFIACTLQSTHNLPILIFRSQMLLSS